MPCFTSAVPTPCQSQASASPNYDSGRNHQTMNQEVKKYFEKQPKLQKEILEKVRAVIQKAAPEASELMSYGVPAFKLNGQSVLYAAFKAHIGLYPEPATIKAFEKELKNYSTSKGTIRFELSNPIPYDLIEKIVKYKYEKMSNK